MPVNGDAFDEIDETFNVNLSGAVGRRSPTASACGTITDDDLPPALTINDVTVTEGNTGTTTASFTVSLSSPSGQTVSVQYATANGTATAPGDYAATTGTVTFTPGQSTRRSRSRSRATRSTRSTRRISSTSRAPTNATISDGQGVGTIIDDDGLQELFVNDVTVTEGQSGTVNATFTVSLPAPSGQQ